MRQRVSIGSGTVVIYDALGTSSTWACHGMTLEIEDARPGRTMPAGDRPRALRTSAGVVITLGANPPPQVRAEYPLTTAKASRPSQAQWKTERKGRRP